MPIPNGLFFFSLCGNDRPAPPFPGYCCPRQFRHPLPQCWILPSCEVQDTWPEFTSCLLLLLLLSFLFFSFFFNGEDGISKGQTTKRQRKAAWSRWTAAWKGVGVLRVRQCIHYAQRKSSGRAVLFRSECTRWRDIYETFQGVNRKGDRKNEAYYRRGAGTANCTKMEGRKGGYSAEDKHSGCLQYLQNVTNNNNYGSGCN